MSNVQTDESKDMGLLSRAKKMLDDKLVRLPHPHILLYLLTPVSVPLTSPHPLLLYPCRTPPPTRPFR